MTDSEQLQELRASVDRILLALEGDQLKGIKGFCATQLEMHSDYYGTANKPGTKQMAEDHDKELSKGKNLLKGGWQTIFIICIVGWEIYKQFSPHKP